MRSTKCFVPAFLVWSLFGAISGPLRAQSAEGQPNVAEQQIRSMQGTVQQTSTVQQA